MDIAIKAAAINPISRLRKNTGNRSVESTGRRPCVFITSDVPKGHQGLLTRAAPIGGARARKRCSGISCVIVLAACASNARAQGRDLNLTEGRGELLQFQKDIQKVAISEPKVAD